MKNQRSVINSFHFYDSMRKGVYSTRNKGFHKNMFEWRFSVYIEEFSAVRKTDSIVGKIMF